MNYFKAEKFEDRSRTKVIGHRSRTFMNYSGKGMITSKAIFSLVACILFVFINSANGQSEELAYRQQMDIIDDNYQSALNDESLSIIIKDYECSLNELEKEYGTVKSYSKHGELVLLIKEYGDQGGHCGYEDHYFFENGKLVLEHFKSDCWFFNENVNIESDTLTGDDITDDIFNEEINYFFEGAKFKSFARETNDIEEMQSLPLLEQDFLSDKSGELENELLNWFEYTKSDKSCDEFFEYNE